MLKTHDYSDSISRILSKPIRIAAKYGFASSNFHKTHANKSEYQRIFKKPTAFLSFCRFSSDKEIVGRGAGERPAVEKMC